MSKYYIGFDVGSDSIHAVVLDKNLKIKYSPESQIHFGNPIETLKEIYEHIISKVGYDNIITAAFTGSVGEFIAKKTNSPFFYDTIVIPIGVSHITNANYIFHIGAKDPYFFDKEKIRKGKHWKVFTQDHGTGTKCGGGSGILITKQARRFFEIDFPIKLGDDKKTNRKILQKQLNQIFKKAEKVIARSDKDIDVGGRCGVVIQSDMIHLQNSGEQIKNILKGMYKRIIRNYRCDVLKTRILDTRKKAVATGGIFANKYLAQMLEKELGIKISIPENFQKPGAIGAAVKACNHTHKFKPEELDAIAESARQDIKTAPPLHSAISRIKIYDNNKRILKKDDLIIFNPLKNKNTEILIGVDGGSTTTKAIIAKADNLKIIAEICLYTSGKPLQTAQEMFRQIRKYLGKNLKIKGVAYTGSSGSFYYKLFTDLNKHKEKQCVDLVKDEITCHALGVKHFNNKIDTIFELGGQDAKFTLFNRDGTVKKAKMNLSCMAGTGQTMQNMVEMLGLDIKTTFHEYALKAEKTPIVDETCGVFTEAGIAKLIAMGFPKEEIAAAIAYGFMGGYINKFVGNEKFGNHASAQGGPFNGDACLAALALHTNMKVNAFPHRQLFGALGAVIAVYNEIKKLKKTGIKYESKFRGLNIADMKFDKRIANCSKTIKDSCGLRDCQLQIYKIGKDIIYSGGLCPKGNTDTSTKRAPNYISMYKKILEKHLAPLSVDIKKKPKKERVLLPRSLTFLNEKGVFYTALYNALGFDVAISPPSDDEIANAGINYAHSEACFPVKLAHGHAAYLKKYFNKKKDKYLFINAMSSEYKPLEYKFCPYVRGIGHLVKDALDIDLKDCLLPVIYFNNPYYKIEKFVLKDLQRVFHSRFNLTNVKRALKIAKKKERNFLNEIYSTGEKLVNTLKKKNQKIFIGIGRGYTLLDDKASSKVHELFASYGMHFIPSFFLKVPDYNIEEIAHNMYWYQGQAMIKYNLMVAMDKNFYAVRETNFNCGTDSFLLYHEEDHLVLQTDGHNSNAQFGTRTLANYEVVKNHVYKPIKFKDFKETIPPLNLQKRIIGVPYMGDITRIMVSALKSFGQNAEAVPTYTKESQELARKLVSTNVCRPFNFQIGDHLAWLYDKKQKGIDPNKYAAIFEPKASGPCRFGQYSTMLRKFLDKNGFPFVPVVDPTDDKDYTDLPFLKKQIAKVTLMLYKGTFCIDVLYDALLRTRPYEKEKGAANKLYDILSNELCALIETGPSTRKLAKFMAQAKNKFEAILDKNQKRKPLVVMNGEIFVRLNPDANQHSIKLLEKYGLEVVLNTPSQWLDYINKSNITIYREEHNWKGLVVALIKKQIMKHTVLKIFAPFADYLKGREPHDPEYCINAVQKAFIYEKRVQGESPLSVGEIYLLLQGDFPNISGIYHVGPFGCMQETAATSKIQALIQQHRRTAKSLNDRIVPFMDAVFGDSELPNLEAEIAAFAEKCYIKNEFI